MACKGILSKSSASVLLHSKKSRMHKIHTGFQPRRWLRHPSVDENAFVTSTAYYDLDLDLQYRIRSSVGASEYSVSATSKLFKAFVRHRGNKTWLDEQTNTADWAAQKHNAFADGIEWQRFKICFAKCLSKPKQCTVNPYQDGWHHGRSGDNQSYEPLAECWWISLPNRKTILQKE